MWVFQVLDLQVLQVNQVLQVCQGFWDSKALLVPLETQECLELLV